MRFWLNVLKGFGIVVWEVIVMILMLPLVFIIGGARGMYDQVRYHTSVIRGWFS